MATRSPRLMLATLSLVWLVPASARAATCTPTGFFRDGMEMTAALINPTTVTSPVNAAGCHIGIYYNTGAANLDNADIYGATYFGVLVNGDEHPVTVRIMHSIVHNIGETPYNGTQHGNAIYIRAFFDSIVTGQIMDNLLFGYQKGGIILNGRGVRLSKVNGNRVFGIGHVNFIAQNGIQVGFGARPNQVSGNEVSANSYIGTPGDGSASAGILVVGGPGFGECPDGSPCPYTTRVAISGNNLVNNDVGVFAVNQQADGTAPPTATRLVIAGNMIGDDQCFNQSYQAGISEQGNTDFILFNFIIQGGGYGPSCGPNIDTTDSIHPVVIGNVPDDGATATASAAAGAAPRKLKVSPEMP